MYACMYVCNACMYACMHACMCVSDFVVVGLVDANKTSWKDSLNTYKTAHDNKLRVCFGHAAQNKTQNNRFMCVQHRKYLKSYKSA